MIQNPTRDDSGGIMYGLRVIVADQSAYLPAKGCCVRLNEVPRSSNLKLGLYKRPAILAPAGFFMSLISAR